MELKEIYKNTEVGVIPEDWEVKPLFEIGVIATGTTPPTNNKNNYGEDYFFVSPADLGKGKYIVDTEKKLSKLGFSIARKYPANSILFTCIGSTIGKAGIAKIELTSNQQINAVFPNESYSSDFLFYYLNFISPKIKLGASEQAVPMINKTEFGKTFITLPTKAEQTAIATALSDADALINNLEKLIAKKRNIKQGAMQKLLQPKEGWTILPINSLANISTGAKNTQDKIEDGAYPFFVRSPNIERINSYSYDGEAILIAGDGVGTGKVMHYFNGKFDFHQRVYKLSDFDSCINGLYFFLYFKNNFYNRIMQMTAKSSVDSIRRDMISNMMIPFPSKDEQTRIATILSDMDSEIQALETKLEKYRNIKLGMMQNLLTGKIRLV
tara:strand:+ start:2702 stop:3850 length:1149 start_codon:yes stop_codon:yes gene_type:complete